MIFNIISFLFLKKEVLEYFGEICKNFKAGRMVTKS